MCLNCELYYNCQQLVITSLVHCGSLQRWWKFNTCSTVSNAYLFWSHFLVLVLVLVSRQLVLVLASKELALALVWVLLQLVLTTTLLGTHDTWPHRTEGWCSCWWSPKPRWSGRTSQSCKQDHFCKTKTKITDLEINSEGRYLDITHLSRHYRLLTSKLT